MAGAGSGITISGDGGDNIIVGSPLDDTLAGNGGNDTLSGLAGNDLLIGGAGADITDGGAGDDWHFVDNVGDRIVEADGEGNDRLFASASYVLGAGVSVEMLTTTWHAGTASINLTGNELVNFLCGNAGNNVLDGGAGADVLVGWAGDDWYYVDNVDERVVEAAGEGQDRVFASVSYRLAAGTAVEQLSTTDNAGTGAINLTGNELANIIYGNAGNNVLNGSAGADTMVGWAGDDWYFVDDAGDRVVEAVGEGQDRVFASVSYTLAAGAAVERMSTDNHAGTAAIDITGNELANFIIGNAGNNVLNGGGGADYLVGWAGDDTFIVDNYNDVVAESAGGGQDQVFASVNYSLWVTSRAAEIERLSTTDNAGTGAINLEGNDFDNIITGNAGSNTLAGSAGADSLYGGAGADILYGGYGDDVLDGGGGADLMDGLFGDDRYFVDDSGDYISERVGEGSDHVFASVSYILPLAVVELLTTDREDGIAPIDLTGNRFDNIIEGNAGNNVLDGGAGVDTLTGFGGADTFKFTTAPGPGNVDRIADFAPGSDRIQLDNTVFQGLIDGSLPAGAFRIGAGAADADDRIIYDAATGALWFDRDGSGTVYAAVQFATLSGAPALSASDVFVI